MHDVSLWSFWFSWLSNLVYFWLDDVANATMHHSVAFKCANDAKKNDPNIYFHMEPGENLNPWCKSIAFLHGRTTKLDMHFHDGVHLWDEFYILYMHSQWCCECYYASLCCFRMCWWCKEKWAEYIYFHMEPRENCPRVCTVHLPNGYTCLLLLTKMGGCW